jgi:HEAT repeat protein
MRSAVLAWLLTAAAAAAPVEAPQVRQAALAGDSWAIQAIGPGALPELVKLYTQSPPPARARIAQVLYELGWKSDEAKRALMADIHTTDPDLRLQVQWALGRVSDDPAVVDVLLENMQNDPVPLFRDKAACALAYDQIHLSPVQRLRLFEGLVHALGDEKLQVRQVAIQALSILTHQTKGFQPGGSGAARATAVEAWQQWLADYRANQ